MSTRVLIIYYSTFGHVYRLARAVEEGAGKLADSEVRLRRVPELVEARQALSGLESYRRAQEEQKDIPEATHDDLRWADGIAWGTPTRFGNMSAQLKQFMDTLGPLWQKGELEDKPAGVFTSTSSVQGGHETTIVSTMVPLIHLGMAVIGTPYGQNPQLLTTESIGSSPYGPGTIAGLDGSLEPKAPDLDTARNLGLRIARFACVLKSLCAEGAHGLQPEALSYRAA
ncbi:MAG TPA: NAD(P)H:quinone oxidoreductase [Gemmatimonadales bacterium]|jgi:NAD(P)H dehydrogenase (quinone)|nr:NAD(P)H:quinone oxidoreductase [Gemmatimonadales bacterium]